MNKLFAIAALLAAPLTASAANYATCLLDKLPGVESSQGANAAIRLCETKHPGGFDGVPAGSGRGLFATYDSGDECILEKGGSTRHSQTMFLISRACRTLYNEPRFEPYSGPIFKSYDGPYTPVKQ